MKFWKRKKKYPVPDDVCLESLKISKERGFEVALSHPLFAELCQQMVEFFDKSGATNFVTMTVLHPDRGYYDLTIQRHGGETPAVQCERLRAELSKYNATAQRSFADADGCDNSKQEKS